MGELIKADFKNKTWKRPSPTSKSHSEALSKCAIADITAIAEAAHDAGFNADLAVIIIPNLKGEMVVQEMNGVQGIEGTISTLREAADKMAAMVPDSKK